MYGAEADGWATVRFSLGRQTTGEEIRRAVEVTASLALRLREPRARTAPGEVLL
jgi:cysteine sulfinate desulfinase/cysteine desulfurase-like protein